MEIKFVTSNPAKVELARQRLAAYGIRVNQTAISVNESQDIEVEKVANYKAQQVMKKCDAPFIIEDSAFYIDALNGFPGTFVKMAFETLGEKNICSLIKGENNKHAFVKSILIYGNPQSGELREFTGIYEGTISDEPRGSNMRGWAVVGIFIPKGWNKTLAELDDNEWLEFLEEFRQGDHFEKFGKWLDNNK